MWLLVLLFSNLLSLKLFTGDFGNSAYFTFFISVWGGLFFKERHSLYQKWLYLAGLYNNYLKETPQIKENTRKKEGDEVSSPYDTRSAILASLCIDILHLEMWSHRSFRKVFKDTLEKALDFYFSDNAECVEAKISDVINNKVTYSFVSEVLGAYQNSLLTLYDFPERYKLEKSA